jgi:G2/mitotic-specific cyclin-B, other
LPRNRYTRLPFYFFFSNKYFSLSLSIAILKRGNGGAPVTTVQHIDVEPTVRVTRRQSREKEEREKAEAEAALRAASSSSSSSSSSNLPASSSEATMVMQNNNAEIKSSVSSTATAVAKKTTTIKAKKPTAVKVRTQKSKEKVQNPSTEVTIPVSPVPLSPPMVVKKAPLRRKMKRSDPSQCLEIIVPMYNLFYQQEDDFLVAPYMSSQKDINNRMRGILVDWLVEVHYKFRLQSPTLWLCVNLLDRFLEKKTLLRNKLQLLGVTCLLVACKFEEIYPPEVRDCVYITDNAYKREEVLDMEQSILSVLDYQLCVPTGYHFLTRYLNIINANEKTRHLAFYYAERNLQESISFNHKPSQLVSASLYAALVLDVQDNIRYDSDDEEKDISPAVWPDLLIEETGFDESDLLPVAKVLMHHVGEEPVTTSMRHLIAAKKKYLNDKFFNVAEMGLPTL